tara:strand:- start:1310 stop:1948 length:639 start_codon:yes stop_codon:yes gene_type:complete
MDKEESIKKKQDTNIEENNIPEKETENISQDLEENNEETNSKEEIEKLKDKLARTFAEMENQRRRFEKEKEEALDYGGFAFARESLNLLDNLERSKISLENDESLKNTETLKKVIEHLDIINKDMLTILKKNQIEPIKSINEKLNPNFHQAMIEIEDDSKETGTIVQEIQKGFIMKDRLLRPSLVGVSKKKSDGKTENVQKNEENDEKNTKN